ncbi:CLUMA_CG000381, isoform A [Clunio marinus]|uniref:CLUMA_CG000381, isoform A n=1 Tax=Clunio marinus TaxID=568069 RepID=A0A1J1HED0_9DIPT|nr:CLUMA_CG000381, isoform A [Clunio marinus]
MFWQFFHKEIRVKKILDLDISQNDISMDLLLQLLIQPFLHFQILFAPVKLFFLKPYASLNQLSGCYHSQNIKPHKTHSMSMREQMLLKTVSLAV